MKLPSPSKVANLLFATVLLAMTGWVVSGVDVRSIAQDLRTPPATLGQTH